MYDQTLELTGPALDDLNAPYRHEHSVSCLGKLRQWWYQPHSFSIYEKIFFYLSAILLLAGGVLLRDVVVLFAAKSTLETTGDTIKGFCAGLTDTVIMMKLMTLCGSLQNGMTAVFNLNAPFNFARLPAYLGVVLDPLDGPIPRTALQTVPSWINPVAFRQSFSCQAQAMGNVTITQFIGHSFAGILNYGLENAGNGFPVHTAQTLPIVDALKRIENLGMTLFTFMVEFCISVKNGGQNVRTNPNNNQPYGSYDGFERFGDDFKQIAYIFSGILFVCLALAALTLGVLIIKKAATKWIDARKNRDDYHQRLFAFRNTPARSESVVVEVSPTQSR